MSYPVSQADIHERWRLGKLASTRIDIRLLRLDYEMDAYN